jgi:hypothetical protein
MRRLPAALIRHECWRLSFCCAVDGLPHPHDSAFAAIFGP